MKNFLIAVLIVNLLVLDISLGLGLYRFFKIGANPNPNDETQRSFVVEDKTENGCSEGCKDYVDEKVAEALMQISPIPTTAVNVTSEQQTRKARKVYYVPIPGSGSSKETVWTSLSGTDFYLTKADYPGLVGVYFEANIKLINGNGTAFVRLYDATHSIAVSGSEVSTSNQSSTFVTSGPVSLWEGYNNYQIQVKSLTADTSVFDSGRLKIITEE